MQTGNHNSGKSAPVYWRVEGSLLNLRSVRPVGFFTWNAQTFSERWLRRGSVFLLAALRPVLYLTNRRFATRAVYMALRGVSRDRLDLLGEEYFQYQLKPHLKEAGVKELSRLINDGHEVVLVSQGLSHVIRPMAQYLGVKWIIANRLEFRSGIATGRLLDPVVRPRRILARMTQRGADGTRTAPRLARELGLRHIKLLEQAKVPSARQPRHWERPIVNFEKTRPAGPLSVHRAFRDKHILLIGVTGFIGKVWLANTLMDLPEVSRIYLLIRRQKSNPALKRFEKLVEESPVFDPLYERYGADLAQFLEGKVEVLEGDASLPDLGLDSETSSALRGKLDLIINSSGLTDFNPDLRDALTTNVDAVLNVLDFVQRSDHAGLVHLSTCYVAGARDGRVGEKLRPNYTPAGIPEFDAERELRDLHEYVAAAEARAESAEITAELTEQARGREHAAKELQGAALENQIRKNRIRWLKAYLTEAGTRRAKELGWPNTYTLTKSLTESLIAKRGAGLPVAIVRPAIVETSTHKPFPGWNEGINTSASLSYLLGTSFRQLPSNEHKRLDIIPVDAVCAGMTLISAAVIEHRNEPLYQLATSVTNPCDMGRSIELTSLAHRKHYRAQEGLEYWLRLRLDAIPVSKTRYNRMSAPAQKAIIKSIQRIMSPLPLRKPPLAKAERNLERVEKLIELFEPFILLNEHDFVAENVERLSYALVPEERAQFGYDTRSLDWWDYWINIHIPALRKWTYPLIEGRPLEARVPRVVRLSPASDNGVAANTGTNGASWRYS